MKNINKILLLSFMTLIIQPLTAWSEIAVREPVSSRNKNLFVFKTDRKFVGAKVEVLYSNGYVLTSQMLKKRKMIIDFCDVKHGSYIIRISKDNEIKEYQYEKK